MTDTIETTPLITAKPKENGVVRIRGRATNLLNQPNNPGNVVLPPAYEIDRTGKILYTFDLQFIDEKNPLDYTISLENKHLYTIECTTSTQSTRAWTVSRDGNTATELATLKQQLTSSQINVRYSASGTETTINRNKDFESRAGNGGKIGRLNWRNTTRVSDVVNVELECRDSKSFFATGDRNYWAVITLNAENPFSCGKIHILHIGPSQEALDELVITGFGFMMLLKRALLRTGRRRNRSFGNNLLLAQNVQYLEADDFEDD